MIHTLRQTGASSAFGRYATSQLSLPFSTKMNPIKNGSWKREEQLPPNLPGETKNRYASERAKTSILMELNDYCGSLQDVLKVFWKFDLDLTHIQSRPAATAAAATTVSHSTPLSSNGKIDFFLDFYGSLGDENVDRCLENLKPLAHKVLILDPREVNWFPRHISELDLIANRVLDAGVDIESDHPGFHDPVYRTRRGELAMVAREHKWHQDIKRIEYTPEEIQTWKTIWINLEDLWEKYACKEYKRSLSLMKKHCNYSPATIPQQTDINKFLQERTGFRLRPVAGLLSSRDFLNSLAFRVFFATQYIRHHSNPLYTPEPDICHELLGHVPMLLDRDFADFSQEIGLASLGASDEEIDKLAYCYWHSVEFGLCREEGGNKAYGAGLLSSFGEMEHACDEHDADGESAPEIKPWDPAVAATQDYPVTTYQPLYFCAESLSDAKKKMRDFCKNRPRPFYAQFNPVDDMVTIDRPVLRSVGVPKL